MPRKHRGKVATPVRAAALAAAAATTGAGGKTPRGDVVYRGLRRAIIEQALAPGAKLPEDLIGDRFGVSRTGVRAALARLAAEGVVELRMNRGAFVARPSLSEANAVFEVRISLERLVMGRLAGQLARPDATRLRAHVAAEEQAKGRNGPESIRLAGEFHVLLAELTGNGILSGYVSELVSRSSLILALYGRPHSSDCAVTEHREIIAALVMGDGAAAGRVMDHHLDAVIGRALIAPSADRNIHDILSAYTS